MAAEVLVQLSTSDEQDSEDDITSSASCSGMSKSTDSTLLSERGDMDSSSSTSAFTSATEGTDTSKRTSPTLLSVLQQAKLSDLSRKRVICNNIPPKGKKRKTKSATGSSSSLKSVTPRDRCNQFPKDYFTVSGGKLFCECCREELSLKLSSIKYHIDSNKHKQSKEREAKRKVSDKTLADHLQVYERETNPRGETLSESHNLNHISCIE